MGLQLSLWGKSILTATLKFWSSLTSQANVLLENTIVGQAAGLSHAAVGNSLPLRSNEQRKCVSWERERDFITCRVLFGLFLCSKVLYSHLSFIPAELRACFQSSTRVTQCVLQEPWTIRPQRHQMTALGFSTKWTMVSWINQHLIYEFKHL